jgi:hypothetical protein
MPPIEIARAPSHELDAVLQALLRGRFTGLSDGLRIGIEAHHLTLWKCLGYCHCNTADAPADIENAAPILQSLDDLRELCEPIYACAGPTYVLQSIGCAGCSITQSA